MTATDINNEMFLELVSYFQERAKRFGFPESKIGSICLDLSKENLYAKYKYYEDSGVTRELHIWNEGGFILFRCDTLNKSKTETIAVLKTDILRCKQGINEFFSEFLNKYKDS